MSSLSRLRNALGKNYINHIRGAQNLAKQESDIEILHKQDPQLSQSQSGVTVASVENYSPVTHIAVTVKAGSRYENGKNEGIAHCLRNCATLSNNKYSAFVLTRSLEQIGAKFSVSATRDYLIYNVHCFRDNIEPALEVMANIVTNPVFFHWEVKDSVPKLEIDLALHNSNPQSVLLEALHKAAFRGGLKNSLFMPKFMLGKHNPEMLFDFMNERFTAGNACVTGTGIPNEQLQKCVDNFFNFKQGASESNSGISTFAPGEIRIGSDLPQVHTAIVAEGAGLKNAKDALSLGVLQCILGEGNNLPLGGAAHTLLGQAAAKCTIQPFNVCALNLNYSDTGLFGVYITGHPDDMNQVVKSVVSQMRSVAKNISDSAVETGKHKLKAKLLIEREEDQLSALALDAATSGKISDIKDVLSAVDGVKTADVAAVASRVMKAKPAMASVGRLHSTPHLDQLL